MLNDMAWRKTPRDLLTNPKIRTIARKFEAALRPAIFAFYTAVYMQADDDGVVDLSERDVFAELLMLDDEDLIVDFIARFEEKGYLEKIGNSGSYYITDWDNPNKAIVANGKRIPETAEERRARVLGTIEGRPRRKKMVQDRKIPEPEKDEVIPSREEVIATLLQEPEMRDKNPKSVATDKIERDNTDTQIEILEKEKDTHTEKESAPLPSEKTGVFSSAALAEGETNTESPESAEAEEDTGVKKNAEISTAETQVQDTKSSQWTFDDTKKAIKQMNMPEDFAKKMASVHTWEDWQSLSVIYNYFRGRAYPFFEKNESEIDAMKLIVLTCKELSEPKNAPYVIAGQLCRLYGELRDQKGVFSTGYEYFKNFPNEPSSMVKPSAWSRIVTEARKVLSPGVKKLAAWQEEMERDKKVIENERQTYNGDSPLDAELLKHGLDPGNPTSMAKLLAIQAAK